MPQATPPPPPWERGQGHVGRPERPATYARFRAWLELGPSRNLATYAAVLGVSKQALNETAARFNWRQRAAAWDATEAAAGRCPPPPPPRPKEARRPSSPQKPPPTPSPDPAAMGAAAAAAGSSASDAHLLALSKYRRVMEQLGRGMAAEAESALGLVTLLREDLAVEIERRRRLATTGDHAAAAEASQGAAQIVVMIARLAAVVTTLAAAGRQHWGDAIGVHKLLEEAFAVRKGQP
jgi:hypothetical protein